MEHRWLMPCLVVIGLAAVVLITAGVEAGTLVAVGAAIVCPLMMLVMMGGGIRRFARRHGGQEPDDTSLAEDATARP